MMITETVKITSNGKITIPKAIRKRLKSSTVFFEVMDDDILIRPVKDVAGSLISYSINSDHSLTIKSMKEKAWEESVYEKTGKQSL